MYKDKQRPSEDTYAYLDKVGYPNREPDFYFYREDKEMTISLWYTERTNVFLYRSDLKNDDDPSNKFEVPSAYIIHDGALYYRHQDGNLSTLAFNMERAIVMMEFLLSKTDEVESIILGDSSDPTFIEGSVRRDGRYPSI